MNVVPIRIPPLRERRDDIPELVRHFVARAVNEGLPWKTIDDAGIDRLKIYHWPGNVRELENLVRRLAALYSQEIIGIEVIEAELSVFTQQQTLENSNGSIGETIENYLQEYFPPMEKTYLPMVCTIEF